MSGPTAASTPPTQVPEALHVPVEHVPHVPPQPSLPHVFPLQLGEHDASAPAAASRFEPPASRVIPASWAVVPPLLLLLVPPLLLPWLTPPLLLLVSPPLLLGGLTTAPSFVEPGPASSEGWESSPPSLLPQESVTPAHKAVTTTKPILASFRMGSSALSASRRAIAPTHPPRAAGSDGRKRANLKWVERATPTARGLHAICDGLECRVERFVDSDSRLGPTR